MSNTTEENKQVRWKSWALWLSIAGALWTVLSLTGVTEKIGLTNEAFNTVLDAIGTVLITFGIVNNPTDSCHL